MKIRIERDSMGEIEVEGNKLWGAQTQRSVENFKIGTEKIPEEIIRAFGAIKAACAKANKDFGKLNAEIADSIFDAGRSIYAGNHMEQFPLVVWQTGSGTQTNMNVNEVISKLAMKKSKELDIHPNDHVNMSQSSNDIFPSVMNISFYMLTMSKLIPAIDDLINTFEQLEMENNDVIKIGRTHLQDAVPIKFSQEISAWTSFLRQDKNMIINAIKNVSYLAVGGTAVGTGLNAPKNFGTEVAKIVSEITGYEFKQTKNAFAALSGKSEISGFHSALKSLACDLMKIANDIRWLASGPRAGLGEIAIPSNEPGSSIMPGKVNPTQCEAVSMVACQVMGNDVTVTVAASQGNFQLNVYMPVIAYDVIQSINLLSDVINSFNNNCCKGIRPREDIMRKHLDEALMMVTALNSVVGYDIGAKIAKEAYESDRTLREVILEKKLMTEEKFNEIVDPNKMV